jgi:hypothetical protein
MRLGSTMNSFSHSTEEILNAAHETSAWCDLKWDKQLKRESLRQYEIAPQLLIDEHSSVNGVIVQRRAELKALGIGKNEQNLKGNYLVFQPTASMSDYLPETETDGFFDAYDCPPWGLWVGYKQPCYLISWVPDYLFGLVEKGLSVSSCDPCWWLDEMHESWAKELKSITSR